MLHTFVQHVRRQHLFPTGQEVLLAVSGGVDSVVLADLMHAAGFPFAVAHCNFRLRPGDCDRDEAFVRDLAAAYGVPFHVARFDTADYAASHGCGIEDAARRLRYDWFHTLCVDHGYPALLTAHHADDAAETFFLNLLRGTGLAGLHGILPVTPFPTPDAPFSLVRPLLPFSRADIEAYAAARGLAHVEDATNASLLYRRNQVRHRVVPLLRELQPAFDTAMRHTLANLQSAERLYRHLLEPLRAKYLAHAPDGTSTLALDALLADIPADLRPQLLFELLHPLGFTASQCADLLANPRSGARFLTPLCEAVLHRGALLIAPAGNSGFSGFSGYSGFSGFSGTPANPATLHIASYPVDQLPPDFKSRAATAAFFDADTLRLPLNLRPWRHGDRFQPLGMEHGSQLVSDYFTDHHVALPDKRRQLLLVDADDTVLWIVGRRTSHPHRVTSATRRVLEVSLPAPCAGAR